MAEQTVREYASHRWYARPVWFVSNIQHSLDFYVGKLGFEKQWHEADGKGGVCQVHRSGCEIILCEDAGRRDRGRLFIELTREGFEGLLREAAERSIPTQKSWWGNDVIRILDPDDNELLFPVSNE
ncbi:VOC family protein [Dyella acidiphila]|uniref:Bleomycin resistance family protein n=1 Tax=Dyella acidiphila TaxID=2775866 RepID=A0ABR9G7C6_9GAMM|nr:VOC family protein [Dyella acidiphila]MBE1159912.1 bleomycin resistance family protein [Dyella acidiphila]